MKNKKMLTLGLTLLSTLTLTVVGASVNNHHVNAATKHTTKSTKKAMNIKQIEKGNYSSIKGDWKELGHIENHSAATNGNQLQLGGDDVLAVSKNKISSNDIKMHGDVLVASNQSHDLKFKADKGALLASLKEDSAINWSVSFYPKGTTTNYSSNGKPNDTDFIVVWTSNNNHTEIFVPNEKQKNTKATNQKATKKSATPDVKKQTSTLNLAQIQDNDFSSLQGTWKNPTNGKTYVVTNKVEHAPEDSNTSVSEGAVVSDPTNDISEVISGGTLRDGYIQGAIGTYDKEVTASPFSPILIVPKGVKATTSDDSNSNKDRLILGGGQGGYSTEAYYKE